jgi:hypothetical protein
MRKSFSAGLLSLTLAGAMLAFASAQNTPQPPQPPRPPSQPPQDTPPRQPPRDTPTTPARPNVQDDKPGAGDAALHKRLESQDMRRCIELCGQCAAACERTSTHCLTLGGQHVAATHQNLLRDCATICATSACFMSRGSERHDDICRVCAEICEQCAKECEQMGSDDPMMIECAKICRDCAESCRKMATMS